MIDMKFNEFHIKSNRYGFSVYKMSIENDKPVTYHDKAGEHVSETPIGYYNSLNDSLINIRRFMIRTGSEKIETLEQFIKLNKKIKSEFEKFISDSTKGE